MPKHLTPGNIARGAAALAILVAIGSQPEAQHEFVPAPVKAAAERISTENLARDLEFLASDALQGRNTPSPGFDRAAEYIERRLRSAGLKPLGDHGTYRQHYVMRETTLTAEAASLGVGEDTFGFGGNGFTLRTFAGELTSGPVPAVYVGHGWTADGVDPYRNVDVRGKIVIVHAQDARPAGITIEQIGRVTLGGTPPLMAAHRRGAVAIAYLAPDEPERTGASAPRRSIVRRELEPGVPSAYAAPPLTSIQLGAEATRALLEGTSLDPARLAGNTEARDYPASFELPGPVTLNLPAVSVLHRPFNVVALVEGTDPVLKDEYIVVQSHLDGAVGMETVDGDGIYNAADDNASGSSAALSIAEQMMSVRPRRSLVFMWDSGEEQGLWGTRQFVSAPPIPFADVVALVNLDMIGANRAPGSVDAREDRATGPDEVFLIGPGVLSDRVNTLLEHVNDDYLKLNLNRKYDTPASEFFYPRTDAGPFLERGVLTIGFTTGIHDRYHRPADEARFLDPTKITRIARTVFAMVHALGQTNERPRIEQAMPHTVKGK